MTTESDELIPVRMLNEIVYCPRLFYLEWVEGRFADNDDTIEGRVVHQAVDRTAVRVARAKERITGLLLASERLGIVGRMDAVEIEGRRATPIDHKRGRAAALPHGEVRLPEKVQICAHVLLLRDAGFESTEGAIWFAGDRRRVPVPVDERLERLTLAAVEAARELRNAPAPPLPLLEDPRCPRCSLVGICLPDELAILSGRRVPGRRLVPTASAARPLYVTAPGASVRKRGGTFEVYREGERIARVRRADVSQIVLFGGTRITGPALMAAMDDEAPVAFFTMGGWFRGAAWGLPSGHVALRRAQVGRNDEVRLALARTIVRSKIRNQRTILRRNAHPRPSLALRQLARLADDAAKAATVEEALGIEGVAARVYFAEFPKLLRHPERWLPDGWQGRSRRPPADPVNAGLSFLYALLVKELTVTVWLVGFDPHIGFMHRPRHARPALALDLAEEFRPLICDSLFATMVNTGELKPHHFVSRLGGSSLTAKGRRIAIGAYERRLDVEVRHPMFGYRAAYRRILEVQARLLAAMLVGEVDVYTPFETR